MPAARTPRRNGPYAPLSAFYADDDAVIALEDAGDDLAELLFLRGLAHCAREPKLNGYISAVKVRTGRIIRRPAPKLMKASARLIEVGLWTEDEDGGWRIKQWTKWNATHEEIVDRLKRDATRKSGGADADSARNVGGTELDSAPQYIALHDTSLQDTAKHGSSTLAAAAFRQPLYDLATRITNAGLTVTWELDTPDEIRILAAIERSGIDALVKHAKDRHRKDSPAFSVNAWLSGWDGLPPKTQKLELVFDPCEHGHDHPSRCATCKAPSRVAS
jgi:hypothetical protein